MCSENPAFSSPPPPSPAHPPPLPLLLSRVSQVIRPAQCFLTALGCFLLVISEKVCCQQTVATEVEQKESIDVGIFHVPRHFVFNALQFMYFVHFFHLVNGITLRIKLF